MSDSHRSFFSSVPGVLTGTAGILSALAAVGGLALQQGWIGGSDGAKPSATAQGGRAADGGAGTSDESGSTTRARGAFSVNPTSLAFQQPVGDTEANVKVSNTGAVALRLHDPMITGADADRFEATNGTCDGTLDPGRSCELNVSFTPKTGRFNATLVVSASGAQRSYEVPLRANALTLSP